MLSKKFIIDIKIIDFTNVDSIMSVNISSNDITLWNYIFLVQFFLPKHLDEIYHDYKR